MMMMMMMLYLVCLLVGKIMRNYSINVYNNTGKVLHDPRNIPVDFTVNPDHTLGLWLGFVYGLGRWVNIILRRIKSYPATSMSCTKPRSHLTVCITQRLFNSKNFAGLVALAELCALW